MSDSFWIITTFAAGFIAVIAILINLAQWFFAKPEGRYFITRGFGGKGLDLIRHQPMSNKLKLTNVVWKGRLWSIGQEGMMFGLDKIQNPTKTEDYLYNDLVGKSCTWDGAKRPVVIATDIMSTVISPAFYAAVAKADAFKEYPKAAEVLTQIAGFAKEYNLEVVTFAEIISPDTIKKYLKDVGPQHIREAFKKGVEAQKLADTKPPGEGFKIGNWAWYLFLALGAVVLIWFGMPMIQNIISGF